MNSLNRKRKTKDPCQRCFLNKELCICPLIPKIETRTRLLLIIHNRELKRTTNTGRLAIEALVNSKMLVRGKQEAPLDLSSELSHEHESLLFFPSDDAIDLSQFMQSRPNHSKPIQLIVPDGNWRQASKVGGRQKELSHLPRVKISKPNLAESHLRKEHFIEGMSTLEAIAHAFGEIEGLDIKNQLNCLYEAKLRATLLGRGSSTTGICR